MADFSACFLLVFGQLAVGGLVALAVPPFAVLERGFYKSSAGVFLASGAAYVAARVALAFRPTPVRFTPSEIVLWGGFLVAATVYLWSLWGDARGLRARAYATALLLGVGALAASARVYGAAAPFPAARLLYPVAFLTGALVLGAVATGMLLGHWYLIDLGLSIEPLRRLFRYFVGTVLIHGAVLALTVLAVTLGGRDAAAASLWQDHAALLALRVLLGPLAALGLGLMIRRTLQIPQTMAATGLFYIAILFVLVGEILGRFLLFRTALPL
ncbi:MAG TPA: hypothetical protein VKA21_15905 [Candidatus Binatia bacterium]|nr:hypothetical protein [Candidatus Binatia bacterium]